MKTLLTISVLLQPNTQKTASSPPSMVSAELSRDLIFHSTPFNPWTWRQHSNSSAGRFWQGWVRELIFHLLPGKSRWCSNSPSKWYETRWAGSWAYSPIKRQQDSGSWCPDFTGKLSVEQGECWTSTPPICNKAAWVSAPLLPRWCWQGLEAKHTYPAAHVLNLNRGLPAKEKGKRRQRWNVIQSFVNMLSRMSTIQFFKKLLIQQPGKSQHEWEKTINRCQQWDESNVGIIW